MMWGVCVCVKRSDSGTSIHMRACVSPLSSVPTNLDRDGHAGLGRGGGDAEARPTGRQALQVRGCVCIGIGRGKYVLVFRPAR